MLRVFNISFHVFLVLVLSPGCVDFLFLVKLTVYTCKCSVILQFRNVKQGISYNTKLKLLLQTFFS